MSSSVNIKAYKFALDIEKFSLNFTAGQRYFVDQLLRSAISAGANVEEALGSYSKREFRAKMSIAYKEASEAKYWIHLLNDSEQLPNFTGIPSGRSVIIMSVTFCCFNKLWHPQSI